MLGWLRRWGWIVLFAIGAILVVVFSAGKVKLDLGREIKAAKAEGEVEKIANSVGRDAAVRHIEKVHAKALAALDEKNKVQAEALKQDPKALARFLVTVGNKST